MPYYVNEKTGIIDYDQLEMLVKAFKPKLIVAGSSAYSRNFDYGRMKKVIYINLFKIIIHNISIIKSYGFIVIIIMLYINETINFF